MGTARRVAGRCQVLNTTRSMETLSPWPMGPQKPRRKTFQWKKLSHHRHPALQTVATHLDVPARPLSDLRVGMTLATCFLVNTPVARQEQKAYVMLKWPSGLDMLRLWCAGIFGTCTQRPLATTGLGKEMQISICSHERALASSINDIKERLGEFLQDFVRRAFDAGIYSLKRDGSLGQGPQHKLRVDRKRDNRRYVPDSNTESQNR